MIRKENNLSVRRQCELLGVNRSALYYKAKDKDEEAAELREKVMGRIDYWHIQLPGAGTRKIAILLQQDGYNVGRKYVRKCFQDMAIRTIYPKENLSRRNFKETIVPYLLRNCDVRLPNQVWSIDITFIKMYNRHMYLTALIDWYSRKIVGWRLSDTLETEEVVEAVKEAVAKYGSPGIINSDQGSQFTSKEYKQLLKDMHIRQSMDGKSRWADNIMIERWFRSLKTELIYINEFKTPKELRIEIGKYINTYNMVRPHESLDYATPESVYTSAFENAQDAA